MFSWARADEYRPLPQSPKPTPASRDSDQSNDTDGQKHHSCFSAYVPVALCVLFTLLNILVTVVFRSASGHGPQVSAPVTSKNIHLLRRPSQYIRFDEVHRPSPPIPKQFRNYPITVAQVDATEPERILYADKSYMAGIGTILPGDRRVLVTPTISTIVQFRTIDWGMEDCRLHLSVPRLSGDAQRNISLALYRLNQTYPIDTTELSFHSRPPRFARLEEIEITNVGDTDWSRSVACRSDDVLSFEFECSGIPEEGGCFLEWWQKKGSETAVYLTQHATV
ncbi:hypothetical protein C8R45DRAFT_1023819 [Mycena sanguinolenta]|nr:hypothetical protein C8R45DRAFT_1023819 [Mycena sanguinolenta]